MDIKKPHCMSSCCPSPTSSCTLPLQTMYNLSPQLRSGPKNWGPELGKENIRTALYQILVSQHISTVFVFVYHSSAFRSGVGKQSEPGTYGTKVKDLFVFFKLLAKIVSRKFFRPHFTFPTNSHFSPCCCLDHLKRNVGTADVLLIFGKCIQ